MGTTDGDGLALDADGMASGSDTEEQDEYENGGDASGDEEEHGWDMAEVDNEELLKSVLQKTSRHALALVFN